MTSSSKDPRCDVPQRVEIIDCTLRDGEQTPGVWFTVQEKVELAKRLSDAGVDMLDAGFPAASGADIEAMQQMRATGVRARLAATARPFPDDVTAAHRARADEVFLFMPTSDLRLRDTLGVTHDEATRIFHAGAEEVLAQGMALNLVFEDATRADSGFLVRTITQISEHVPISRVVLADTVGCAVPASMQALFEHISARIPDHITLCCHCHNDFGLATANTLAAVCGGAGSVTCTVNGVGERAGNADLAESLAALTHLYGVAHGVDARCLPELAAYVERISGIHCSPTKPVTGYNVYRHESGVHVDGMLKNPRSYEHLPSHWTGRTPEYVLGKHSGRSVIRYLLEKAGLPADSRQEKELLAEVKATIEAADKSLHEKAWVTKEAFREIALSGIDPATMLAGHRRRSRSKRTSQRPKSPGHDVPAAESKSLQGQPWGRRSVTRS